MSALSHGRAIALMVLVTLMWSTAGVVARHLHAAQGFEITFWRSAFTALSLLVILPLWQGAGVWRRIQWRSRGLWVSGVCWSVMFTAFMLALTLTTVANVLLTMSVGPLVTALMSRIWLGHRLKPHTWAAIAVAGAGIAWMQSANLDAAGSAWLGFAVALCVPLAAGVQWTLMQQRHATHADEDSSPFDMVPAVLLGAVFSCFYTLPLAWPLNADAHDLALLAGLGLTQLAIPCALAVVCATVLKAPEVALLALLEVIFGIVLAWLGAGEAPGPRVLTGGLLVLGALVVNGWLNMKDSSQ